MSDYYSFTMAERGLKGAFAAVDELKDWIHKNIFILKIGTVKSFDSSKQTGEVLLDGVLINAKVLNVLSFILEPEDQVVLIQAKEDIFSESDGISYSLGSVYILQPVFLNAASLRAKKLCIELDSLELSTKTPLILKIGNTSLASFLESLLSVLTSIKVVGDSSIEPSFYAEMIKLQASLKNILTR